MTLPLTAPPQVPSSLEGKEEIIDEVVEAWLFLMAGNEDYVLPDWFDRSVRSWILFGASSTLIIEALCVSANRPDLEDSAVPRYTFGVIRNMLGERV